MKHFYLTALLSLLLFTAFSQIYPDKYYIQFTDKNNSPYSLDNPSEYLTQRAIDRRINQGIPIEESDLPVNPAYLQGVEATGAELINPTKWLNGVTIYTDNPSVLDAINALPYVVSVTLLPENAPVSKEKALPTEKPFFKDEYYGENGASNIRGGDNADSYNYGLAYNQIHLINGDALHNMGFTGEGMVIAQLDAGYYNVNTLDVFDSLWQNNQILGTRDFVKGGEVTYDQHYHGTMVLSCMGGLMPGQYVGTAPKASYWLLRSEDGATEYIIEEYNWVSAAEFADSVGADVINSSLGYTQFDDPAQNHTYADMDGNTTPSTRGADMAAKKGILVVNSLGNSGNDSWYYLSAPSDGDSVMGIGAVNGIGNYASFSSHGPSYDGRVKPDVVAQGSGVYIVDPFGGGFQTGGGTSFASPILAGTAACLWQANPSMNNMQIATAIKQSASLYTNPNDSLGYGLPDFAIANDILTIVSGPEGQSFSLLVYPNPTPTGVFTIDAGRDRKGATGNIEISDVTGRRIGGMEFDLKNPLVQVTILENAPKGIYFATVTLNGSKATRKIIKE